MLGQNDVIRDYQNKFEYFFYFIVTVFVILLLRVFYLQQVKGHQYFVFSQKNFLREKKILGARGRILDREGRVLVDNRLQLNVVATPQFLKKPKKVFSELADLIDEDKDYLFKRYKAEAKKVAGFQSVVLIPSADFSVVAKVESHKKKFPGVNVEAVMKRSYLHGPLAAHVFGYLSEVDKKSIRRHKKNGFHYSAGDLIGRYGLEQKWESKIRGQDGVEYVQVDAHGHQVASATDNINFLAEADRKIQPKAGLDLKLTLDLDLLKAAEKAMQGKMGSVVALDPRNGEVLAMTSQPSFDPTQMGYNRRDIWSSLVKNKYGTLRNKAIQDHFSAGSTFKPFTLLAAMEKGVITPFTTIFCPPSMQIGRKTIFDHNKNGFGLIGVEKALSKSSNMYLWKVAQQMEVDDISNLAKDFGFGEKSQIGLYHEVKGLMPTKAWAKNIRKQVWTKGETLSAAIGQSANLVTPLQLANAYATLVNGGKLRRPILVKELKQDDQVVEYFNSEVIKSRKIDPSHLKVIKKGLWDVASFPGGTSYWYTRTPENLISGKTGTSQVFHRRRDQIFESCWKLPYKLRHHAWFVGYAPAENPEIVVSVLVMHGCAGSKSASPVAKSVFDTWWKKKQQRDQLQGPNFPKTM